MSQSNIKPLTAVKRHAVDLLHRLANARAPHGRLIYSPNTVGENTKAAIVEATLTAADGTTFTQMVAVSGRTPIAQMADQVRAALNDSRLMQNTRLERIATRIERG